VLASSGVAVPSSQNSAILLGNTDTSVFRIPTSFPPKFVSTKPNVAIVAHTDVGPVVGTTQQVSATSHLSQTSFTFTFSFVPLEFLFTVVLVLNGTIVIVFVVQLIFMSPLAVSQ